MAAISRVVRSARDSASVFCRAILPANTEMARKTVSRSRSAPVRIPKLKYGGSAKKSRQAVETSEDVRFEMAGGSRGASQRKAGRVLRVLCGRPVSHGTLRDGRGARSTDRKSTRL